MRLSFSKFKSEGWHLPHLIIKLNDMINCKFKYLVNRKTMGEICTFKYKKKKKSLKVNSFH